MHVFSRERKYASGKKGLAKGDTETFKRRIYLHIYFSLSRHNQDRMAFESDLVELKNVIESGVPIKEHFLFSLITASNNRFSMRLISCSFAIKNRFIGFADSSLSCFLTIIHSLLKIAPFVVASLFLLFWHLPLTNANWRDPAELDKSESATVVAKLEDGTKLTARLYGYSERGIAVKSE